MESPGPGGLASLRLVALGTPKPVCAPSNIKHPHQDTRGSGLQWAPWGLAYELGTQQAEVDPPELQAQKVPRGGPWLGSVGSKPSAPRWGQRKIWWPPSFPRAHALEAWKGPEVAQLGPQAAGRHCSFRSIKGPGPRPSSAGNAGAPAWPQPSGTHSAHRGLSSASGLQPFQGTMPAQGRGRVLG